MCDTLPHRVTLDFCTFPLERYTYDLHTSITNQVAVLTYLFIISINPTRAPLMFLFFFLNDPPTPEISPLSLHAALPLSSPPAPPAPAALPAPAPCDDPSSPPPGPEPLAKGFWTFLPQLAIATGTAIPTNAASHVRSEEHTSELQSQSNLVCRLLLEKKKH